MPYPASFGLLLIRGILGYVMIYHGAAKLFSQKIGWFGGKGMANFIPHVPDLGIPGVSQEVLAYAAALAEFGGGILLMLGLATRFAAVPVAITMGVAAFKVHGKAFSLEFGGMEFALTLMLVAVGLIFTGPGKFSIDTLFRRRSKSAKAPSEKKK